MRRSKQCPKQLKYSFDNAGRKDEQGAGGSHKCLKLGHLYDKWQILLDVGLAHLRKCATEYYYRACLMPRSHKCLKLGYLYDKWQILLDKGLAHLRKCATEYYYRACLMPRRRTSFELV